MMQLSGLYRYPLKSAQGETLERAEIDPLGVAGDRRWMVAETANGRFVTQRSVRKMTQLRALWQGQSALVLSAASLPALTVAVPDEHAELREVTIWGETLQVPDAGDAAALWLSDFLGRDCRLVQVPAARARQVDTDYAEIGEKVAFADGFPLLLIGQASLDDLSARVGRALSMERFRPNLVVAGSEAYAEDDWKRIRIGELEFRVVKGCSRCIITSLDPNTGERSADGEPLATLKTYRLRDKQVYFGQNLIPCGEGVLDLKAPVEVLE